MEAGNWLAALGLGLDKLGLDADFNRLACEVLPNGTVIAQDVRSGSRFVVRPESEGPDEAEIQAPQSAARPGDQPRFKEATAPALGFLGLDTEYVPPEEIDTVVPDEDEDLVGEPGEEEMIEVVELAEAPTELMDEEGATLDEDSHSYSSQEGLLLDSSDEEVQDLDSRAVEPLAPEALHPVGLDEEEEEEHLLELLESIRHSPSDFLAWQTALDVAMALVPSEAGSALQREDDAGVRFVETKGPGAHALRGARLPRGIGIIGFCMDRIASIIVQDPKNDPRFYRDMDDATGFATRSVLCVPVAMEGEVYGCLELINPPPNRPYNRADIEHIEIVAGALADRLATGRPGL